MSLVKKVASKILKKELSDFKITIDSWKEEAEKLKLSEKKLQRELKQFKNPTNILLAHYRIDNVSEDGIPPSYLKPQDKNEYLIRIHDLDDVFHNKSFREMIAWTLNFHANLLASGTTKNEMGDVIEVKAEKAQSMIEGVRSIWKLIVAAHVKDEELKPKHDDTEEGHDIISELSDEGN